MHNKYDDKKELFNYTANTITVIDFIYIAILSISSANPWMSAGLVLAFPLLNVPTVHLSHKYNKNFIDYTLALTLIPLFFVIYVSGSDAPGWLPAFSLLIAIEILVLSTLYKKILQAVVLIVVAGANYTIGLANFEILVIDVALLVFILLITNIFTYITNLYVDMQVAKQEVDSIHKKTKESIQYAALIQNAILPKAEILENYFKDSFTFWKPKDIVGGDIYFVTELESKNEVLVMVIDGAGHGVPGAFLTMLVKAIETQIHSDIENGKLEPSPALILEYFNRSIKTMLKQEKGSRSNAGFDGGVLYYNKATNVCKYAGAKTDLYIINDNNLEVIKSDRKNVGFVRTKIDQKYTEHTVEIQENTRVYIATDGIYDQEGLDDKTYGKKEFQRLLIRVNNEVFSDQENEIRTTFESFKAENEQSDDVTVVGLKF